MRPGPIPALVSPGRQKGEVMGDAFDQHSTVFVVDDDRRLREELTRLFESAGFRVRTCNTIEQFLLAERPDGACCLLLNFRMPGSGLTFRSELARAGIAIPLVFIADCGDIPTAVKAIRSGAIDYLSKPLDEQRLLAIVQEALHADQARRHAEKALRQFAESYRALNAHEREVVTLLCEGWRNKQMAARLGLAEVTIKKYRRSVLKKLGTSTLPALVRMADRLKKSALVQFGEANSAA